MSNPVDEYLEKHGQRPLTKAPRQFGEMAVMMGERAALLGGAIGLALAGNKVYRAITKKRDFNAMMEANPDLEEERKRDPKTFNRFYNSLRSMNPQFAAEPVVAGTYMKKMLTSPEQAGGYLVDAMQATKGVGPSVDLKFSEEPTVGFKT